MIDYEVRGRTALITINRPESRNAIDGAAAKGLKAAVVRLEAGARSGPASSPERAAYSRLEFLELFGQGRDDDIFSKQGGFGGFVCLPRAKPMIAAVDGVPWAGGRSHQGQPADRSPPTTRIIHDGVNQTSEES